MTVLVALGLLLQFVALLVMWWAVRGRWVRHVGALVLLVAVAYHGGTELLQALFPGRNVYRLYVTQDEIDAWVVLVSVALLLYSIAYAATLGVKHRATPPELVSVEGLGLRWFVLITVPMLALALQGFAFQAGNGGGASAAGDDYLVSGLVVQFVVLLLATCSALAIIKFGPRWTLPVLVVEAALIATVGARSMVVIACTVALYGAALAGVRMPRKQLISAGLVVVLLGMSISAGRAVEGRAAFDPQAGATQRVAALSAGFAALPTGQGLDAVLDDFVYRLDGNMFGARVLAALERGVQPVGTRTFENNMMLAVPSFLDPSKLRTSNLDRNEKDYFASRFGLPSTSQIDVLPTVWGTMIGYGGSAVLLVLSLVLGMVVAAVDRWVMRGTTHVHFLLGLGLVQFVLSYERGWQAFFVQMRGVLLLMAAVWILHVTRRLLLARRAPTGVESETGDLGRTPPLVLVRRGAEVIR